jgi:hypothetical protein
MNNRIVLVCGKSATGKSMSLHNLRNPEGVMYLNCENNKALPFKFLGKSFTISDPMQVYDAFVRAEKAENIHTIVIDTLTFLMDMYESKYVLTSPNTQKAWGDYAQFFKNLMQEYVAKSTKTVVFLAHTTDVLNEAENTIESLVKVKGSLMNTGIEAAFTNVIATKRMPLTKLADYANSKLVITEDEEIDGFKYVFQTKLTKGTIGERIRAPMGMWTRKETFIDNSLQHVLDTIDEFYK